MVRASAGHSVTGVYTQLQVGLHDLMDSRNKNSGALKVVGGLGVSSNVNIGGSMVIDGDITVLGTQTVNDTVTITTDDKNIILANTTNPTDTLARGGGVILKGSSDKSIIWGLNPDDNSDNNAWNFNESINLASGKSFTINGNIFFADDTLGESVLYSSLSKVGNLNSGFISENFGNIDIGSSKFTGGNLIIKSNGSNVFNINSSTGITQSLSSNFTNSSTITGFNQTQLNNESLLNINKTFIGDQLSTNTSKAVQLTSSFNSTSNYNKNNTLTVESLHSGIASTGGTFHNHNKTIQNFAASFNASQNTESRISSYGINSTAITQQTGYNIGGIFEAKSAAIENTGVIAIGSGDNSVNAGIFGTVNQTRDQVGTYIKGTLHDSLYGIQSGLIGYNPSTASKNFALYTDGYNYLGGNTSLNGTLSVSGTSFFNSNLSINNSYLNYTDSINTFSTGIKNSKYTISNNNNNIDTFTITSTGTVKISSSQNSVSPTTGALVVSGGVGVGGDLHVAGIIKAANDTSGTIIIGDSSNNDNIEINAELTSNFIPDSTNTYDLGSSDKQWNNLYVDGITNLDQTNIDTTDGNFNVSGTGIVDINTDSDFSGNVLFSNGYSTTSVEVQGGLKLSQNNSSVIFKAPTTPGNTIYVVPNSYGSPGQVLTDDGAGNLYWTNSQDATNVGNTGYSIFKQTNENTLEFKKINAGNNITLSDENDVITIDASFGSSTNTLIEGNINVQNNLSVAGNTTLSNIHITNDLIVDAPESLFNGNLTIGNNNNGKKLKFFGTSSGNYIDYNYTENQLRLNGPSNTVALNITSGNSEFNDNITVSGISNLTNVLISNNLSINGTTTISNTLITNANISNNLSVNGVTSLKNTTITGNSIIDGTLSVANTITGNLSGTLLTASQTNITDVGTLNNLDVSGNVTIGGDLNVTGTTVTVSSENLNISDPILLIGSTSSSNSDQGLIADRTSATNVGMIWNETNKEFTYIYTENTGTTNGNVELKTTDGIDGYADLHSGNLTVEKGLTFNNTTKNQINLPTNTSDALVIQKDDINKYMTFSTNTSSGKKIYIHKELAAAGVLVSGSNFVLTGGSIDNIPIGDTTRRTGKFTTISTTNTASLNSLNINDKFIVNNNGELSLNIDSTINANLDITETASIKNAHISNNCNINILSVQGTSTFNNNMIIDSTLSVSSLIKTNSSIISTNLSVGGNVIINDTLSIGNTILTSNVDILNTAYLHNILSVENDTILKSSLSVGKSTILASTLNVEDATILKNTLSVNGATNLNGSLKVIFASQLQGTLSVADTAFFNDNINIKKELSVKGDTTFSANTYISNNLSVENSTYLKNTLEVENSTYLKNTLQVYNNSIFKQNLSVGGSTRLSHTLSVANESILAAQLSVGNSTTLKYNLSVGDTTTLKSTLSVGSDAYFNNTINVNSDSHLKNTYISGQLSVQYLTTIESKLTVNNNVDFTTSANIGSTLSVFNNTTIGGTLSVAGDVMIDSNVNIGKSGSGYLYTIHSDTPYANLTYDNFNSKLIINGKRNFDALVISRGDLVINDNLSVGEISTLKDINTSGNVIITNNISIGGTTNINNLQVQSLDVVEDFITIGLNNTNNSDANGGGIKLKAGSGADKTFLYSNTNDIWESSLGFSIDTGNSYKINNVDILNATTLGSSVVSSSLTSVDVLDSGSISSNFGDINIGSNQFTTTGTASFGTMYVDQINLNNSTISLTGGNEDNIITIPDNLLDAFSIREGTNKYIDIKTTNDNEHINIYKNTTFSNTVIGTNFKTGNITINEDSINFGSLINNLNKLTITDNLDNSFKINSTSNDFLQFNTNDNIIYQNSTLQIQQGNLTINSDINGNNNVRFYGTSTNDYLLYDQSLNKLNLINSNNSDALYIQGNCQIDGNFNVDGDFNVDGNFNVDGDFTTDGTINLSSTGKTTSIKGNLVVEENLHIDKYLIYKRESIITTSSGIILNNDKIISEITIDEDNSNITLSDGNTYGQIKRIIIVYANTSKICRINISNFVHGSYIEFYNTGQSAELIWTQSRTSGISDAWCLVGGSGGLVIN